MSKNPLSPKRVQRILTTAREASILVLGDVMLDQFIWGNVSRISPEAPVPVVDFARESFMPGGAANVARNLSALGVRAELFGIVGQDHAANQLRALLTEQKVSCAGLVTVADLVRATTPPRPIPELEADRTAHEREVLDAVRELIHTECRIPLDQIRAESRLLKDLKLD